MKTNKLKFDDIHIGMRFYKFSKQDPDEYTIYTVYRKHYDPNVILVVSLDNINEDDTTIYHNENTDEILYDDYLNNKCDYVLIDRYKNITLQFMKFEKDNKLRININGNEYDNSYSSFTKYNKPSIMYGFKFNIIISMYDYISRYESDIISTYIIKKEFLKSMKELTEDIKFQFDNAKILEKDNPIPSLVWDYVRFNNLSNPKFFMNKLSLKEYTIDFPDNYLPEEYINEIIKYTNITKAIKSYELYEYDESIDLSLIKYNYLVIYSINDDAFYLFLYSEGESLYILDYEKDQDTKDVVDFMLRRGKK